jgi:hypothetical protein
MPIESRIHKETAYSLVSDFEGNICRLTLKPLRLAITSMYKLLGGKVFFPSWTFVLKKLFFLLMIIIYTYHTLLLCFFYYAHPRTCYRVPLFTLMDSYWWWNERVVILCVYSWAELAADRSKVPVFRRYLPQVGLGCDFSDLRKELHVKKLTYLVHKFVQTLLPSLC